MPNATRHAARASWFALLPPAIAAEFHEHFPTWKKGAGVQVSFCGVQVSFCVIAFFKLLRIKFIMQSRNRGCQMADLFSNQKSRFGHILEGLEMKKVVIYFLLNFYSR
jgi:hypothetical protein